MSHGCPCCHILPAPWVKGSRGREEAPGRLQRSSPARVRKCVHCSPSPLHEALLSSVHFPLLFLSEPNALYMSKSRQILMAKPWKIKCRWNELQWKMWSFFPTFLALHDWDVTPVEFPALVQLLMQEVYFFTCLSPALARPLPGCCWLPRSRLCLLGLNRASIIGEACPGKLRGHVPSNLREDTPLGNRLYYRLRKHLLS